MHGNCDPPFKVPVRGKLLNKHGRDQDKHQNEWKRDGPVDGILINVSFGKRAVII